MFTFMSAQVQGVSDDPEVDLAVEMFRLLGEPTRLKIIWELLHGEHSVNDLADHVGVLPAATSQHLAKLRLAGLVRTRRAGTRVYYQIDDEHVRGLVEAALVHVAHHASGASTRQPRRATRRTGQ